MTAQLEAMVEKATDAANAVADLDEDCSPSMMRSALLAIGVDKMVEALQEIYDTRNGDGDDTAEAMFFQHIDTAEYALEQAGLIATGA